MRQVLADLNKTIAARGAMVVTPDGFLVASDVREGTNADRLSALGAAILVELRQSLQEAGLDSFRQVELATEYGRMILVEAGPTYLLVLLGARLEIGPGSIEIRSAAQRIAKETELAT